MVILRPTQKLSALLPPDDAIPTNSDTALGDWYVNRLVVDRKPLLLLVSSASLLAMLIPARDVAGLPDRLSDLVCGRLRRLGVEEAVIAGEAQVMAPVVIGRTVDRSVLGTIVDFAKMIPYYLTIGAWDEETLLHVELRLADTPCRTSRASRDVLWPRDRAPELLRRRWLVES